MVFDTLIQQNVKLAEAPSYGQPVVLYDAECRGSVNYLSLANELLEKTKNSLEFRVGKECLLVRPKSKIIKSTISKRWRKRVH